MAEIQFEFPRDRARAQLGQKVDATAAMVVSATSNAVIPFGALVVNDDTDAFLCQLPTAKAHMERPLGIALRQLHCALYEPKNSIAVMRKGRIWIEADKVSAPGDAVYIKFAEDGSAKFSSDKKDNARLFGAMFNLLVSTIAEDTNNVLLPDTLLLPVKHFAFFAIEFERLARIASMGFRCGLIRIAQGLTKP